MFSSESLKALLQAGNPDGTLLDTGTVTRAFPDQEVYDVTPDRSGGTEQNCISLVGGLFMPWFGFKLSARLPVGTKVLLLRGSPSFILCSIPAEPSDEKSRGLYKTTTGAADVQDMGDDDSSGHHVSHRVPVDLLEGEFNIQNLMQVGIQFLTSMIKVQAGDRSKIECFVMDDLVRIVSGAFHQMHDMGDRRVTNRDGRLDDIETLTSHEHEAWGTLDPRNPKLQGNAGGVVGEDPVAETGRWRYQKFVGHLGDFVHMFLTDPAATLGNAAQETAGKFHVHVASDGGLLVQSLADITFERVSRILVPQQIMSPDHPDADGPEKPDGEFLDTWKLDPVKPWNTILYLREYARWLNSYHAYARFHRRAKEWKIPTEETAPQGMYASQEKDRERAIPATHRTPRLTYSCIRILRDGSHVFLDGYGGSWHAGGGSAVISMPEDLRLEAGRNLTLLAGHSIFLKARRNLELVAVTGALLGKARTRLALWCEKGTILLKTLMTHGAGDGDPAAHRFGDNQVGIVLEAPTSDILVSSARQTTIEGLGDGAGDGRTGVVVASGKSDIQLRTGSDGSVAISAGNLVARLRHCAVVSASEAIQLTSKFMNWGNALYKGIKGLVAQTLKVEKLQGNYITHGQLMKRGKREPHANHVSHGPVDAALPEAPASVQSALEKVPPQAIADRTRASTIRPLCDYLPPSEYGLTPFRQSLAQQIAATGSGEDHPAGLSFAEWAFVDDDLAGDQDAQHKRPWPGQLAKMETCASEAMLHRPSGKDPKECTPDPPKPEQVPPVFHHLTQPA